VLIYSAFWLYYGDGHGCGYKPGNSAKETGVWVE